MTLLRLFIMASTDAAMIPALMVMKRNRRHFECFIGCFQLCVSFMFNASAALEANVFLSELDWHFVSDVLSISYALLLFVHLMGFENENLNIMLRYLAFSFTWIAKLKDQWDSNLWQTFLISIYAVGVIVRHAAPLQDKKVPVHLGNCNYALISLGILGLVYILSGSYLVESDPFHMIYALYHLSGGAFFYFAWLAIPCRDTKKYDDLALPQHSTSAFI